MKKVVWRIPVRLSLQILVPEATNRHFDPDLVPIGRTDVEGPFAIFDVADGLIQGKLPLLALMATYMCNPIIRIEAVILVDALDFGSLCHGRCVL